QTDPTAPSPSKQAPTTLASPAPVANNPASRLRILARAFADFGRPIATRIRVLTGATLSLWAAAKAGAFGNRGGPLGSLIPRQERARDWAEGVLEVSAGARLEVAAGLFGEGEDPHRGFDLQLERVNDPTQAAIALVVHAQAQVLVIAGL